MLMTFTFGGGASADATAGRGAETELGGAAGGDERGGGAGAEDGDGSRACAICVGGGGADFAQPATRRAGTKASRRMAPSSVDDFQRYALSSSRGVSVPQNVSKSVRAYRFELRSDCSRQPHPKGSPTMELDDIMSASILEDEASNATFNETLLRAGASGEARLTSTSHWS
jgi:hypothetical protein